MCVSVCAADIWAQSIPHTSVSSNCLNPSSWEFTQETTHILYTAHTRKDTITNNAHAEQHTQSLPEHDLSLDVSGYVRLSLFAATPASCWTLPVIFSAPALYCYFCFSWYLSTNLDAITPHLSSSLVHVCVLALFLLSSS